MADPDVPVQRDPIFGGIRATLGTEVFVTSLRTAHLDAQTTAQARVLVDALDFGTKGSGRKVEVSLVAERCVLELHSAKFGDDKGVDEQIVALPSFVDQFASEIPVRGDRLVDLGEFGFTEADGDSAKSSRCAQTQTVTSPPRNLVSVDPAPPSRLEAAVLHPTRALLAEPGQFVGTVDAIEIVEAGVQVFEIEDVVTIGELAVNEPQATLPVVGACGAGVCNLQVCGKGACLVNSIVQRHAGAVFRSCERCLYMATGMSIQPKQIVLEHVFLNQIRGSLAGVDQGLQRRLIANLVVVFVIDHPVTPDTVAHGDGADFVNSPGRYQKSQQLPRFVLGFDAQILFAARIDVERVGQDVDAQQAELMSRAQQ